MFASKKLSALVFALFAALSFSLVMSENADAAARSVPIQNFTYPAPPNTGKRTVDTMKAALIRGAAGAGWQVKDTGPNELTATIHVRTHTAVVAITFDADNYAINYKSSVNLGEAAGTIHPNYNKWVERLHRWLLREVNNL